MSAEPKRVSFMTIAPSTEVLKKTDKDESTGGGSKNKSIRLELEIYEPDTRRNSDFNYKKLIHIEKVYIFFLQNLFSLSLCDAGWETTRTRRRGEAKKKCVVGKRRKESIYTQTHSLYAAAAFDLISCLSLATLCCVLLFFSLP
jgi:hypothetical protein